MGPSADYFVLNLSKHILAESEKAVLKRGLNFALATPQSNLDIACAVESIKTKLHPVLGMEFSWKIRSMLQKSKPITSNITREEYTAIKSLKLNKNIRILPADKGDCSIVLNETTYKDKLNTLLESGTYKILSSDPMVKIERKIQTHLSKHKSAFSTNQKIKLTLYHSKALHLYGLPKIHKSRIPLRPIVSSIGSPCYALAGFIQTILKPLAGNSEASVKNSDHFIQLLKPIELQDQDILFSFDVVSLFTNVPIEESLQIIKTKLDMDQEKIQHFNLKTEVIMEILEVCMRITYFQVDDKFYEQKEGMAMGSPLSPVVSNIFMETFEQLVLSTAQHKPKMWLRYVDDLFVI
jgi:hypothetical protein